MIIISFKLSNVKCRLSGLKIFLKRLNDRSTLIDVISAYLMDKISEGNNF
jgi:hypothetical protein